MQTLLHAFVNLGHPVIMIFTFSFPCFDLVVCFFKFDFRYLQLLLKHSKLFSFLHILSS